jgi:hypothetical protein
MYNLLCWMYNLLVTAQPSHDLTVLDVLRS